MTDWLDPSAWESVAKTATTILDGLTKMRDRLSRKKVTRKLDQEVDALRAEINHLIDLMIKHVTSQGKFVEAFVGLLQIVASRGVEDQVKANLTLLKAVAGATKGLQEAAMAREGRLKAIESRRRRR
jgi:hypothetical protein